MRKRTDERLKKTHSYADDSNCNQVNEIEYDQTPRAHRARQHSMWYSVLFFFLEIVTHLHITLAT